MATPHGQEYETVGLQLGLTLAEVHTIRPLHQSLEDQLGALREIFGWWRRNGSPPYSWRTIIDVLKCASAGEVLLSEQLIR